MKSPTLLLLASLVALAAGCAALTRAPPPEQNAELRLDRGLAALEAGHYAQAFDDLAWVYSHCSGRRAGTQALVALAALDLDPRNRAARPAVGAELLGRAILDPGTPNWLRPMAESAFLTALGLGAPHPEGHRPPEPDVDPEGDVDPEAAADPEADVDPDADVDPEAALDPDSAVDSVPAVEPGADMAGGDMAPMAAEAAFGCGPVVALEDGVTRTARTLPTLPGPSMATLLARSEASRDSVAAGAEALRIELATVRQQLAETEAELERIRRTLEP